MYVKAGVLNKIIFFPLHLSVFQLEQRNQTRPPNSWLQDCSDDTTEPLILAINISMNVIIKKIFWKYLSTKKFSKVADLSVTELVTHPSESLLGLRVSGDFSPSLVFLQRISHPLSSVGCDRIIAAIQSSLSVSADEECCISVKCYYYC